MNIAEKKRRELVDLFNRWEPGSKSSRHVFNAAPKMMAALEAYEQARRWATGTEQHRLALDNADQLMVLALAAARGEMKS